jgi:LacI family transcriptional regulator
LYSTIRNTCNDKHMNKRITILDIANELAMSRNTVSKAINGTGSVSAETREKVLQKAAEIGYRQFRFPSSELGNNSSALLCNKEIALLTNSLIGYSHFCSNLINSFEKKISKKGYRLSIYTIGDTEIDSCLLPTNFNYENTDGIICMELFSRIYSEFLCKQGIPTIFVDTAANISDLNLDSDILYMENHGSVYIMLKELIEKGYHNISFVGDRFNCNSFYERWKGYCDVLNDYHITVNPSNCILDDDSSPYTDPEWLSQRIAALPLLPQVFFCANDFLAISTLKALRKLNYSVPEDILLCGFDNSIESQIIEPALSTVNIPSDSMGYIAADMIFSRIEFPDMPYRITYIKTNVLLRESTMCKGSAEQP